MIFTQPIFFVFLALTFAGYWLLRSRREMQLSLLLVASAVFYGSWNWWLLGLIGFVILVSWLSAQRASAYPRGDRIRRRWLFAGIALNLGVLALFKYFNFFAGSSIAMLQGLGFKPDWATVNILLPVGISFYVFQAISYIVDTARGDMQAEPRLRRVALYIAFFPQLVAGPIVRAASFFPQMERSKKLTSGLIAAGARAFILGLAYKVGIADNLSGFVDPVYGPVYGDALGADGADLSVWSNSALIGRDTGLCRADIFRFCRLFADGDRRGALVWVPYSEEFRLPLCSCINHRFLAAVAYLSLNLAARLSLYSAWREPFGRSADLSQFDDYNAAGRALAWRSVDICGLGIVAWFGAGVSPGGIWQKRASDRLCAGSDRDAGLCVADMGGVQGREFHRYAERVAGFYRLARRRLANPAMDRLAGARTDSRRRRDGAHRLEASVARAAPAPAACLLGRIRRVDGSAAFALSA